jgi:hypothetical protein
MARKLIIVARQHGDLYHYLRKRFAERRIEVILDRRRGERRRQTVPVGEERRRQDRRLRRDIDARLRSRSHVIVTLPYRSRVTPGEEEGSERP